MRRSTLKQIAVTMVLAVVAGGLVVFAVGRLTGSDDEGVRNAETAASVEPELVTTTTPTTTDAVVEEPPTQPVVEQPVPEAAEPAPTPPTTAIARTRTVATHLVATPATTVAAPVSSPTTVAPAAEPVPEPTPAATAAADQAASCSVTAASEGSGTVRYSLTSNLPGHKVRINTRSAGQTAVQGFTNTGPDGSGVLVGDAGGATPGQEWHVRADFYDGPTMVTYCRTTFTVW